MTVSGVQTGLCPEGGAVFYSSAATECTQKSSVHFFYCLCCLPPTKLYYFLFHQNIKDRPKKHFYEI